MHINMNCTAMFLDSNIKIKKSKAIYSMNSLPRKKEGGEKEK